MLSLRLRVLALTFASMVAATRAGAKSPEPEAATGSGAGAGAVTTPAPFPAATRSLRVVREVVVRAHPRPSANRLGRIAADTRVAWHDVVDAPRGSACARWVAIAPRGWLCESEIEPSELAPDGQAHPVTAAGAVVPDGFDWLGPTSSYPELVDGDGRRSCTPAGPRGDDSRDYEVSDFVGLRLDCPAAPALPIAWVGGRLAVGRPVEVRSAPSSSAPVVRTLAPRTQVTPGAPTASGAFVSIGPGEYVAAQDLHIARLAPPPPRLLPDERWIDIDLDQQVLVAYEGARPVYATLVSSGTPVTPTPLGTFRIMDKQAMAVMASRANGQVLYRGIVPWTMYYAPNFALHAAYWHDRFGARMSHGCINLTPLDARVLYAWVLPHVPAGWIAVKGSSAYPGSIVRVRNGRVLAPRLLGYAQDVDRARRRTLAHPPEAQPIP